MLQHFALFHRHHMTLHLIEINGARDLIGQEKIAGSFGNTQIRLGEGIHWQASSPLLSRST
jgi:hypothetical protein